MDALADKADLADLTDAVLVGLLVLGLAEGAVLLLLTAVDGLVGGGADVERVELVIFELELICRGLVASLKQPKVNF